ncbi:MAG TPA: hypothetical protein VK833_04865 [Gillisia sp.]|nr:hypothetical protein [Gillisia sp.]
MKKLGLTLAAVGLFFITGNTQAQVVAEVEAEVNVESDVELTGNEFQKIDVAELPEAITAAILTEFPDAIATDAFVKEDDEKVIYKVKLDIKGQEKKVYLDAQGNWIKKEVKKEESN